MKNQPTFFVFLIIVLMIAAAGKLHAQAPDIEIGDDQLDDIGLPIDPYYSYSYSQSIFLQDEIDIEGKRITKIAYYYDGGRQWSDHINVYMAHTEWTSISEYKVAGLVEVYAGQLPVMNQPGWVEIPLIVPFEYNNQDNLLIAIMENTPGFRLNSKFYSSPAPGNMSILATKDISPGYDVNNPPLDGAILPYRPNIRMWFDDIPDGPAIAVVPSQLYYQYIREQEAKTISVAIYNTGVDDLVISGFDAGDLPYSSSFSGTIAPGTYQTANIQFAPQAVGDYIGYGGFTGNMPDNPFQVYLEGFAVHEMSIIETFQETTFPPVEWHVDENSWIRRGFGGYIGGGNATLQHPGQPGRLVTPKINIQEGDQLIFYAAEFLDGELTVSYSPDMETWTDLASPELTRAFQPYIIDLVEGQHYIGFSGTPRVYLDYVITPPVYQETPPDPAGQPVPADGFENAFVTQTLQWAPSVFADGYRVYVGTDDPPSNVVNGHDNGTSRTFKTPSLDYQTNYNWKIVPYNTYGDALDVPVWSFTTIAYDPVSQFPFFEGFEEDGGQVPPTGWINQDGYWQTSMDANSGVFAAKAPWNHPVDAILISPPLQMPVGEDFDLVFYWKNGNIFDKDARIIGHDSLYVEISNDLGQNWITGGIFSAPEPMETYLPGLVPLADFSGEEIHIRFRHSTNANVHHAKAMGIDDIMVSETVTEPVIWISAESWNAGNIPNNTWIDSELFVLRNLGSDVLTISNAGFDGDSFTTTLDAEEVALSFGEEYHFSMGFEPFSSGDFSDTFTIESNGGVAEIALSGHSIHVNPFSFEGFESGVFPPHGWMIHDEDGDEINWMLGYGNAIPPYNGFHTAISFSYVWGIGDLTPDNWMVTPKIEVGENQEFAFWVATESVNYPYEHYELYLSATTNRLDQFIHLLHSETLQPKDTAFSERVFPLHEYAGQDIYIAFRHTESVGQYLIKIDDVEVRDVFTVAMPYALPEPGEVPVGTEVYLYTDTDGAQIFYTLDGQNPDNQSTLFDDPIIIETDTGIKAIAFMNDTYSDVAAFDYTVSTTDLYQPQAHAVQIYPNPASDRLHVSKHDDGDAVLTLVDVTGSRVMEWTMTGRHITLDVSMLKPGAYMLQIREAHGSVSTLKVIRE
ncbi:MAG: T9SS C-terminal target domain-containing protein [Bacteroidia bacterium]|nr:MAG: T9SS C-terminal target domain-containing protein [Bacteroidia bacterium]